MKIRLIAVTVLSCLFATSLFAGRTDQGTYTAGGSILIDFSSIVGTDINLDLTVGNYLETGIMAGGFLSVGDNDLVTSVTVGAQGKYHFLDNGQTPFSPYIGADLGLAYSSSELDDTYAIVLGARLGFDYFLTENVALDTAIDFHVATDDIYTDDEDGLTSTDATLKVGLAFFF